MRDIIFFLDDIENSKIKEQVQLGVRVRFQLIENKKYNKVNMIGNKIEYWAKIVNIELTGKQACNPTSNPTANSINKTPSSTGYSAEEDHKFINEETPKLNYLDNNKLLINQILKNVYETIYHNENVGGSCWSCL